MCIRDRQYIPHLRLDLSEQKGTINVSTLVCKSASVQGTNFMSSPYYVTFCTLCGEIQSCLEYKSVGIKSIILVMLSSRRKRVQQFLNMRQRVFPIIVSRQSNYNYSIHNCGKCQSTSQSSCSLSQYKMWATFKNRSAPSCSKTEEHLGSGQQ